MLSINCLCRLSICSAMVKMSIKMSANCYCFGNNVNYELPTVLTNICFTIPSTIQLQLQNYCEGVLRATQTTLNCVLHTLILPLLTGLHFHVISKRLIPVLILTYKQLQCYLDVLILFTCINNCHNTGSQAVYGRYIESAWPIYINDLNCTGSEESLWECPYNAIERYSCNHRQDASVICQGNHLTFSLHMHVVLMKSFACKL